MNLAEKMALDCGVTVAAPIVDTFFIPIKNHDYIIIDNRCRFEFGEYDYFTDVIELIKPYLQSRNIEIFQFAHDKSHKLPVNRCFINISRKQEAYLIEKARLVIGNENVALYIAAALKTKSIGLFSTYYASNSKPLWNPESQVILESHRADNNPSYGQFIESPKTVNYISPFVIAKSILDQLNIANDLHKYELLHIGSNFSRKIIEVVPDFISDANFLNQNSINVRFDYISSLKGEVFHYWMVNKKVNIITDKNINVSLLMPYKHNIVCISVLVSDGITEAFLRQCKNVGIPVKIFCNDPAKLAHYQFKFLDWTIHKDYDDNRQLSKIEGLTENSKFISSKILLSQGRQYSCKAAFLAQKPLDNTAERVILTREFELELEFFKIYNEKTI